MTDRDGPDTKSGGPASDAETGPTEVFGSQATSPSAGEDGGATVGGGGLGGDDTIASLRPASRSEASAIAWKHGAKWLAEGDIDRLLRGERAAEFSVSLPSAGPVAVIASDNRLARFVILSQFRDARVVDLDHYDRKRGGLPAAGEVCAAAAELGAPVVLDLSRGANSEHIKAYAREARDYPSPFIILLEAGSARDLAGHIPRFEVPELHVLQYLIDRLDLRGKTGDEETFTSQFERKYWELDFSGVLDLLLYDDETYQNFNQQVQKNIDEPRPGNLYEKEGRDRLNSVIGDPHSLVLPTLLLLSEFEEGLPLPTYRALMQPFVELQEELPEDKPRARLGHEVLVQSGARSRRPAGGAQIVKIPDQRVRKGIRDGFEGEGALEADSIFRTLLEALPGVPIDERVLPPLGRFLARAVWAMGGAQPSDASRALLNGLIAAVPPHSDMSPDTASLRMHQLLIAFANDIRGHGQFGDDVVAIAQRVITLLPRHLADNVDASLFFRCLGRALAMLEFGVRADSRQPRGIPVPPAPCMRGYLSQLEILLGNNPELAVPYARAALSIESTRREEALFLERGALIAISAAAGARYEAWSQQPGALVDEEQARWVAQTLYSDRLSPYFQDPYRQENLWGSHTGPTFEEKQIAHRISSTIADVRSALAFAERALFLPNILMDQVGQEFATECLQAWVEQLDPTERGHYLRLSRWMRERESGSSRTDDLARIVRAGRAAQLVSLLAPPASGIDLRQVFVYERSPAQQARLHQASSDIADLIATCDSILATAKAKTTRETKPDLDRLFTNFGTLTAMLKAASGRG